MRHFTCDFCSRPVASSDRFIVSVEVKPAFNPDELTEEDLETDHLEQVAQLIRQVEETGIQPEDETSTRDFQFDLCQGCRNKFVRDPLGRDFAKRLHFSQN